MSIKQYQNNNLPTTYPYQVVLSLYRNLNEYYIRSIRANIGLVCTKLTRAIPLEYIKGQLACPVLTIKKSAISDDLAKKYQLYDIGKYYQIFTYTHQPREYEFLIHDLNISK